MCVRILFFCGPLCASALHSSNDNCNFVKSKEHLVDKADFPKEIFSFSLQMIEMPPVGGDNRVEETIPNARLYPFEFGAYKQAWKLACCHEITLLSVTNTLYHINAGYIVPFQATSQALTQYPRTIFSHWTVDWCNIIAPCLFTICGYLIVIRSHSRKVHINECKQIVSCLMSMFIRTILRNVLCDMERPILKKGILISPYLKA